MNLIWRNYQIAYVVWEERIEIWVVHTHTEVFCSQKEVIIKQVFQRLHMYMEKRKRAVSDLQAVLRFYIFGFHTALSW